MISPALRYPKSLWSYNPLPTGCVLYLPLWHPNLHGPVFKSIDGYGHTCTRTGGVMDGSGFTADGDDYINVAGPSTSLDPFTLIVWAKETTQDRNTRFVMINTEHGDGTKQGMGIASNAANNYLMVIYEGVAFGNGTTVASNNTWYFLSMTRNGNVSNLYLNDGAGVISTLDAAPEDGGGETRIGIGIDPSGDYDPHSGLIGSVNEVWVYNRILTSSEIKHIYYSTKGRCV